MKMKTPALILAVAACFGAFQSGSDVLTKLGLTPASAKEGTLDTLFSGSAYNDAAIGAFKVLAPAARAEIVRGGLEWIKFYVGSEEFKSAYAKYREEQKPEAPDAVPSADEQLMKQKADVDKQIVEMRNNMAGLDAETKKSMEEVIKQIQAQMAAMENPEQKKLMGQMVEMQRVENQKQYAEQLNVWEENYPADPRLLIKKRIGEFLDMSADVDFSAKLVQHGSLMRFANEEYEGKPSEWKICFRAGKEATEAARAFATAWLAELGK